VVDDKFSDYTTTTDLNSQLDDKANKSDFDTLKTTVGNKAEKTALDTLTATVDTKADKSALTSLATKDELAKKADQSNIDSLTGEIERAFTEINKGKASDRKLNEVATDLESKITENKTALDTKVAQDEFDTLKTTVGNKAEKTALDTLTATVDTKADKSALTSLATKDELAKKADQSNIDSLTG
ncbi:hypothetical protein, partial [Phocoenobacter atlanticus]|uniref:hypothetical protein n=1 Tax=Phocoenobacter atlanticus TaxID=3416742 RepID=UPI00276C0BBD